MDDRALLKEIAEMIDEILILEAESQSSDDPRLDGWIYNLAVEKFGHSMVAITPRLLALVRRGLKAEEELAHLRATQAVLGQNQKR